MSIDTQLIPETSSEVANPLRASRFTTDWRHVLLSLWLAAIFLYLNNMPLFHSDLWGHVAYGHWILEHGRLPVEDPFVPFTEGVNVVDSAWLGQIVLAKVEQWGGASWLSNMYALLGVCTYLILGCAFYLRARRLSVALVGLTLALTLSLTRIQIIRPENFGTLCFATVILLVASGQALISKEQGRGIAGAVGVRGGWPWWLYFCIPLVFLIWANLHGSFVVGLAVLGCQFVGRVLEVAGRTRSLRAVFRDRWVSRWLLLTELAVAASLVNPYGMDLLINAVMFPTNPNLKDVLEWEPLRFGAAEGVLVGSSWVLLVALWRHSRRGILPSDVLLLAVFSYAVISSCRMIGWYGIVFSYTMVPHVANIIGRLQRQQSGRPGERWSTISAMLAKPTHVHTAACVLMIWFGFAFSHLATPVLGGTPRAADRVYSKATPRGVSEFLRKFPPDGQLFNPQWWGDWLLWDGPKGLKVFMTTNAVHLAPNRFWKDYLRLSRGERGWQMILEKYNVSTIVVHKKLQTTLDVAVRNLNGWRIVYEDSLAVVVSREQKLIDAVNARAGESLPTLDQSSLLRDAE